MSQQFITLFIYSSGVWNNKRIFKYMAVNFEKSKIPLNMIKKSQNTSNLNFLYLLYFILNLKPYLNVVG